VEGRRLKEKVARLKKAKQKEPKGKVVGEILVKRLAPPNRRRCQWQIV